MLQRHLQNLPNVLMISKMESGDAVVLTRESFNFRDCVQDVIDRLEPMITKQDAVMKMEIDPQDLELLGDRFYWTQIVFNLIENALKQNPESGLSVTVRGSRTKEGLALSVCDDGVGIPSADLPYIFKRFYRVQKHHCQNEIKGTGLGLSIVARAVEAHGGEISVTSTPGLKTCFTVSLPDPLDYSE